MGRWSKWTFPVGFALPVVVLLVVTFLLAGCELNPARIMEGFAK